MPILDELEAIRAANPDGELRPEEVIDFARNPNTELHQSFTWDDSEAARQHRLEQARRVIRRVVVEYTPAKSNGVVLIRKYHSVGESRGENGGYKTAEMVLKHRPLRSQLAVDVLNDCIARIKNSGLSELTETLAMLQSQRDRLLGVQQKAG